MQRLIVPDTGELSHLSYIQRIGAASKGENGFEVIAIIFIFPCHTGLSFLYFVVVVVLPAPPW